MLCGGATSEVGTTPEDHHKQSCDDKNDADRSARISLIVHLSHVRFSLSDCVLSSEPCLTALSVFGLQAKDILSAEALDRDFGCIKPASFCLMEHR